MFKLYKKLRPIDYVLLAVLLGLTILQVWCTMKMIDYTGELIGAIQYLGWHNDPASITEDPANSAMLVKLLEALGGWENITEESVAAYLAQFGFANAELASFLAKCAEATTGQIWYNGGMIVAVAAGSMMLQAIVGFIAAYVATNLSMELRSAVYNKVDSFSIAERNAFSTPSLITRTTNDVQQVQMANILMLRMAVAAPITAIWAICKTQASSWQLTVATAVAVVLLILFLTMLLVFVFPKFKVLQKLVDKLNGVARENLTGLRVVRAYNAEEYQEAKFDEANSAITKTQLFTGRMMAMMSPGMMILMNGITLAIYWIGAYLINRKAIDYPDVIAFTQLASQIIMAFMMLMMMFVLLPRAQVSASRINAVLETPVSVVDPESDTELKEVGTVEFKDVTFAYPDSDEAVIKNITFRAEKGDTVAFIGSTGSGKSTLIQLVPRFFDGTQGEILVDGVNVKDIKKKTLRHLIGFVPQKGVLFTGTVKENIAFGNPEMSMEEIVSAAKIAEADGFVSEMEEGYDSHISQGGKNVSGGQKQRLSIARAVATKPEILIFDDSFSALDYKTDKKVRANLKEALQGATKLIVAQRIGTIMDADKIIVLDNGEAVGVGTHRELLETCEIYREIALSQLSKEELGL